MDIFKLFGTVIVETKDAIDALEDTADEAKKTGDEAKKAGESAKKMGDGFTKSGNITKKHLEEIAKKASKTTDEIKAEAEALAKSYEEAGDDAKTAMKKAYSDIEKAAEKASQSSEKSSESIVKGFGKVATAAGAVVTAVAAIVTAMISVADNTREYRLEMGKLETAFQTSGHSAETAKDTYSALYSVLGETDRSVEASQHLAKLCETEEELKQWTDICIGAFASFDDSLPIEGLVEAANETAKTGQVTGVLADALNWAGYSEEDFQAKLSACTTEQERATLITETMASLYGEVGEAYQENNADVIEATEAQEHLNEAMARWGEIVEPIVTMLREGLAMAINFAADAFEIMIDPAGRAARAIAGTSETSDEAASKVEELKGKLSALAEVPPMLWTSEHTKQQQELTLALQEAERQYEQLSAAEQRTADVAKTTATETKTAMADASKVPVDAETPVSAYAEIMANDTSMETAGIEAVERTGSSMESAVASAGFDSAGVTAMQKFIEGINSMSGAVMSTVDRIASDAATRMQNALANIQNMANGVNIDGSWAVGLNYVPFDGYIAELHKGEAVLTAAEAAVWRAGKKSGEAEVQAPAQQTSSQSGITIVQNIQTVPQTPVEFAAATEAYFEQARWAMA